MGRLALIVTIAAWLAYTVTVVTTYAATLGSRSIRNLVEAAVYLGVVTALTASAGAYLVTRQGYLRRTRSHLRVPRAEMEAYFAQELPTATVLIPSYREDVRVIRQTVLSAALQEAPYLRVVLLIDDPPDPSSDEHRRLLDQARALPGQIAEMIGEPARRFSAALEEFERRSSVDDGVSVADLEVLAEHYRCAVSWLSDRADEWEIVDHSDTFFAEHVLRRLGRDLSVIAGALESAAAHNAVLPRKRMIQLYRRLSWTFRADITSFERKQYLSLSSEPNKAMNLNSYIGLMGSRHREQITTAGRLLLPISSGTGDFEIPDSDYVVTLDADSVLLPEYCLRLIYLMEQPENADVGVMQTPYSSYPGSSTRIERISGATTDIQHIVHQGMGHHNAAYWVGANAVLRKAALDELREDDDSDGRPIRRFISDRTVIEDTESTLDLGIKGWRIVNYPERLSYSATPPDFGSLCIQRQRWANGGLIILGKLARYRRAQRARGRRVGLAESLLRLNYLASITWSSVGLILLLAYPFNDELMSGLVVLVALPYFLAMSSDLKRSGYKRLDVLRIYGFNLALLAVNTSGVAKSIGQLISGQKIAFARTPKVRNRTVARASFVIVPYLIVVLSGVTLWRDVINRDLVHGVFAGANAAMTLYAIVAFIGVRHSVADTWLSFVDRLYKPAKSAEVPAQLNPELDWAAVLYQGTLERPVFTRDRGDDGAAAVINLTLDRAGSAGSWPTAEPSTGAGTGEGEGEGASGLAPAPGWYTDPGHSGTLRWWDGRKWTASVAPHSASATPQPVEARTSERP